LNGFQGFFTNIKLKKMTYGDCRVWGNKMWMTEVRETERAAD
jgi:hypothetical protein